MNSNYNYMLDLNEGYYLENKESKLLSNILRRDRKGDYVLFTANDRVNGIYERDYVTFTQLIDSKKEYHVLHITYDFVHLIPTIPLLERGEVCTTYNSSHNFDTCEILASRKCQ